MLLMQCVLCGIQTCAITVKNRDYTDGTNFIENVVGSVYYWYQMMLGTRELSVMEIHVKILRIDLE